jgi:HEAT repeat protein
VVAALLKALEEEKDADTRATIVFMFRKMMPNLKPVTVLPALRKAMKDQDADVRRQAVCAIGELGEPKITIPLLIDALSDDEIPFHYGAQPLELSASGWAALALSKHCPEAIPALCKALQAKNPTVRAAAVWALGIVADDVRPLIRKELPAILPLLEDKNSAVRGNAAQAIRRIGAVRAVPGLADKLDAVEADLHKRSEELDACKAKLAKFGPIYPTFRDRVRGISGGLSPFVQSTP